MHFPPLRSFPTAEPPASSSEAWECGIEVCLLRKPISRSKITLTSWSEFSSPSAPCNRAEDGPHKRSHESPHQLDPCPGLQDRYRLFDDPVESPRTAPWCPRVPSPGASLARVGPVRAERYVGKDRVQRVECVAVTVPRPDGRSRCRRPGPSPYSENCRQSLGSTTTQLLIVLSKNGAGDGRWSK